VTLALSSEFPILDIFWTMLLAFGLGLLLWTIVLVFRDLFGRSDIGAWGKTLWVALVLFFPIAGSLGYLISQSKAMGERRLRARGDTDLRMDSYLHTASLDDGYGGVRDVTRTTQAWAGPIRPA
jgi:Phospholipase_D-nuclease N-terminal